MGIPFRKAAAIPRGHPPPAAKMDPSLLAPSLITGFQVALCTLTLTALLELFSTKTVASLLKTTPGLYRACVRANLVNNLAIGPPTYALATEFFVYKSDPGYSYSLLRSALATVGLVVTHALGYHYAHSQMHRPQMYWAHKFHHAFAKHVTPSSANAVSVVEYAYAYMLPFVVGCAVCAPDERALLTAVAVISVNNLLIHTPALEETSKMLPWWAVSTADHMTHHRVQVKHFSAPTISVDRILERTMSLTKGKSSVVKPAAATAAG